MQRSLRKIDFVNRVIAMSMFLEAFCSKSMVGTRTKKVRVRAR